MTFHKGDWCEIGKTLCQEGYCSECAIPQGVENNLGVEKMNVERETQQIIDDIERASFGNEKSWDTVRLTLARLHMQKVLCLELVELKAELRNITECLNRMALQK